MADMEMINCNVAAITEPETACFSLKQQQK